MNNVAGQEEAEVTDAQTQVGSWPSLPSDPEPQFPHLIPEAHGGSFKGFYHREGRPGRPTCQVARQRLHSRCPQGLIITSLLLSAQILQSSNVEFMALYSCRCSWQARRWGGRKGGDSPGDTGQAAGKSPKPSRQPPALSQVPGRVSAASYRYLVLCDVLSGVDCPWGCQI